MKQKSSVYCGVPYPKKGELFCVKDPGHDQDEDEIKRRHATLLGIHPAFADEYGDMVPSQEEWDEWE